MRTSLFILLLALFADACATAPKPDSAALSGADAVAWLDRYCSKGPRDLAGTLVVRANTREFKGQHPASLRFDRKGGFILEVTNILGGTMLRLRSDGTVFEIEAPMQPRYNRKGVTGYLGIEVSVLTQLLLGDLPCPEERKKSPAVVEGASVRIPTVPWIWSYTRAMVKDERVPHGLELIPAGKADPASRIELRIEEWDREGNFARKVNVHTAEGDLKWSWRERKEQGI
jgi:hypothetical protein